jgi:hypothetical protein
MPALKTLPASDGPRVLLIGAEPWLISQVSLLFAPHEIATTALSAADFLHVDLGQVEEASLYKIIWWVDFAKLPEAQSVLDKLTGLNGLATVVLGKLPEEFVLESAPIPSEIVKQQQFFQNLNNVLPEAQFFFGRDMLAKDLLEDPLRFSLLGQDRSVLFDPEMAWFLSSRESFFEVVSPSLIRPHSPRRVIVRGKRSMSTALLKRFAQLCQRYFGVVFDLVPVVATRISLPLTGFVEAALPIASESFLDELARSWPQWKEQLPVFSAELNKSLGEKSVNRAKRAAVEPTPPPTPSPAGAAAKQRGNIKKKLINQAESPIVNSDEGKIEGELARIFHDTRGEEKGKRIDEKVKIVKKIAKKSRKNKTLFFGGMIAMVLGGTIIALWGLFVLTTVFARREALAFFARADSSENQTYTPGFWSKALQVQASTYVKIINEDWLGSGGDLAKFELATLEAQAKKDELNLLVNQYYLSLLGKGEVPTDLVPVLTDKLTALHQAVGELIASATPFSQEDTVKDNDWLGALQNDQQQLAVLTQFPQVFADIFGQSPKSGKQTYAVLLQNNLELRPTGGFIQAVAFLVFDHGLLVDSQVVSVYELDKRLPGSVAPPAEIRKYLGEQSWYLRDSNWNPDFPQSAQRATWFIQQATGFKVDGVVAINYGVLQDILAAIGPLNLTGYDEVLTKDNLLERVEFHSDDELTDAAGGKKEYAAEVFSQMLRLIKEAPLEKAGAFLTTLGQALEEKQLLVSFTGADPEEAMQKLEWNGQIINPTCPSRFSQPNCLVDQVFQVETNVGLNRVNAYIRRHIQHSVDLAGDKVSHTRTVTLENTARSEGWPLGTYKAYLRFILDGEAQPNSVSIDGRKLAGDALLLYGEGGRRVIGVPVEVAPQAKTTLELVYTTEKIPDGPFSFLLFDQKQPGIGDTPVIISLHNPNQKATLIAPAAEIFGSTLEFSLTQDNHLFAGASFQ